MNSTGAMPKKSTMSNFCLNLSETAEDSEMFTNIWLSSVGLAKNVHLILIYLFVDVIILICCMYECYIRFYL